MGAGWARTFTLHLVLYPFKVLEAECVVQPAPLFNMTAFAHILRSPTPLSTLIQNELLSVTADTHGESKPASGTGDKSETQLVLSIPDSNRCQGLGRRDPSCFHLRLNSSPK